MKQRTLKAMNYAHVRPTLAEQAAMRAMPRHAAMRGATSTGKTHERANDAVSDGMSHLVLAISSCLVIFAGVLYVLAHMVGDGIARAGHSASTDPHEIVIANDLLAVPANIIRFPEQRYDGTLERLDIYLHWPSLSGYSEELKPHFNAVKSASDLVFLTIEPRSMSFDISGRIEPIYSRFFDGPAQPAENGLIRQPLSARDGFIDEDLYYEAASPYPFAARCVRETSTTQTPYCLRDIHVGESLMVTFRFHKRLLKNWMALESGLRGKIKAYLAAHGFASESG